MSMLAYTSTSTSTSTLEIEVDVDVRAIQLGKRATYELEPHGTIDLTISHAAETGAGAASDAEADADAAEA